MFETPDVKIREEEIRKKFRITTDGKDFRVEHYCTGLFGFGKEKWRILRVFTSSLYDDRMGIGAIGFAERFLGNCVRKTLNNWTVLEREVN